MSEREPADRATPLAGAVAVGETGAADEIAALRARIAELERREVLWERSERTLRESEERFRQLADNAFDLIVELDADNRMVYINRRCYDVLGYVRGQGRGATAEGLIHPDDRQPLLERWIEGGGERARAGLEARYRHADGSWRWLDTGLDLVNTLFWPTVLMIGLRMRRSRSGRRASARR